MMTWEIAGPTGTVHLVAAIDARRTLCGRAVTTRGPDWGGGWRRTHHAVTCQRCITSAKTTTQSKAGRNAL